MTEMLFLLALLIGPALATYFFFGCPLKGLLPLAIASVLVTRLCWLNYITKNTYPFVVLVSWYSSVAVVILYKALKSPGTATEEPALGLNAS